MRETSFFVTRRLEGLLKILYSIKDSDFAYCDSESAAQELIDFANKQLTDIERLVAKAAKDSFDQKLLLAHLIHANSGIVRSIPYAGLILRSTHTRTAFEFWGPLKRLVRGVLKKENAKLIYSSGWDYSPYTFIPTWLFKDYVIICVPAFEASNPLLLPIAGHELGHHVWRGYVKFDAQKRDLNKKVAQQVHKAFKKETKLLKDRFRINITSGTNLEAFNNIGLQTALRQSIGFAQRQMEELFCDIVAVYLFGESFFHAFAYLLAPKTSKGVSSSQDYPYLHDRARNMVETAKTFASAFPNADYSYPAKYIEYFSQDAQPELLEDKTAREASMAMLDDLRSAFLAVVSEDAWQSYQPNLARRNLLKDKYFKWMVPAENPDSLADIINAAWDTHEDDKIWKEIEKGRSAKKKSRERWNILIEVVLKTLEMLEYQELTKTAKVAKSSKRANKHDSNVESSRSATAVP